MSLLFQMFLHQHVILYSSCQLFVNDLSVPVCCTGQLCCGNSTTNISRRAYIIYQMLTRYGMTFPAIGQHSLKHRFVSDFMTHTTKSLPPSSQRLCLFQCVSNNQSWPEGQQSTCCLWIHLWLALSTLNRSTTAFTSQKIYFCVCLCEV